MGRYLSIKGSKIDYSLAGTLSDGVCDFGGCIEAEFVNNKIHAPMGAAINIGGSLNCLVQDNSITMSGTADGVVVQRREGDGNGHGSREPCDSSTRHDGHRELAANPRTALSSAGRVARYGKDSG